MYSDTAWGGADYLLLQRGEVDDDDDDESNKNVRRCRMNQLQSIALFRWLFGSSTTQQQPQGIMTVLLLRKDGSVWFLVHHADKEWMNALVRKIMPVGRSGPLTVYLLSYNRNDHHSILHGSDQLWKDSELLQSNHCQIKVATFLTEQERNLGATGIVVAIEHRLKQNEEWGRIQLVDAALGVALATAVKEEQEVYYMTQASALSAVLMKHGFQATMLDHLDDETSVSHIDLADYLEGIFNDPSRVSFRLPAGESYGSCYTPIIQSGGEYDLSLDAVNTDKLLTDDVVTVSLGASCEHYCSIIARTYLFNPSESVREIYNILLDMRDKCLTFMRPGQPIKTVYQAAVDLLAHKNGYEYLQDHLPENLGFGTGLVVQEISLCLSASNDTVFEDGMSFCVSFAFQNLREDRPFTSIQKVSRLILFVN